LHHQVVVVEEEEEEEEEEDLSHQCSRLSRFLRHQVTLLQR